MGLSLVITGAPEPREQPPGSVRGPWRLCPLKTSPQGSEARLSCCSTGSHQMEPLPECGDLGAFRLVEVGGWGCEGGVWPPLSLSGSC